MPSSSCAAPGLILVLLLLLLLVSSTAVAAGTQMPTLTPFLDKPDGLHACPGNKSACFDGEACCTHQYFGADGCEVSLGAGRTTCCAPGPALPVSDTLPNCLIIGDSVSDQYTPSVAALLKDVCKVQHAPWVGGGSANNAANGLFNLQHCRWLRTALRPDQHVDWDIIMFNFGLHDLMKTTPELVAQYTSQLENIPTLLLASGAKKVQYALPTPFQADATEGCGPYCSPGPINDSSRALSWPQPTNGGSGRCGPPVCKAGSLGCGVPNATAKALGPDPSAPGCGPPTFAVSTLNNAATGVMHKHGVPMLDLNALVHSHCGANYTNCTLCDDETKYMGVRCGYHYSPLGISILAEAVANSFKKLLAESDADAEAEDEAEAESPQVGKVGFLTDSR